MTRRTTTQYNWDKLLFDETFLTKHYTPLVSRTIKFIVVHHMTIVGNGDGRALDSCYNVWQTREASAHYGIDGLLVRQYVRTKDRAWATGDSYGNQYGISIEHANSAGAPSWGIGDATWKTGACLVAYLHRTHQLGRPTDGVTLRKHKNFTATACPGPYMDKIWASYVKEAQRVYDAITGSAAPAPNPPTPTVDLSKLVYAANTDPGLAQGGTTYPAGVKIVENALYKEGLLSKTYAFDGSYGSLTKVAYGKWQYRLGYRGTDADGIPGATSLSALGRKYGFKVVA